MTSVTISGGGRAVRVLDAPTDGPCVATDAERWLRGWYGTPDAKVSSTERKAGHGAFGVSPDSVFYHSRVVTAGVVALGGSRAEVVEAASSLSRMAGLVVSVSVDDGSVETEASGCYLEVDWDEAWAEDAMSGTVTVVCPDPRRYGTTPRRAYLSPGASAGALAWHADAPHGLAWPLSYGGGGAGANVATLRNDGTSAAYPTITASGDMDGLVLTDASTGAQLAWDGHVGAQPVTLDCLSRTASVAGVDASRLLSSRGFPSIAPGGEVTLVLSATGSGTVEVEWRDTYI